MHIGYVKCALFVSIKNAAFDGNKYLFPTQSLFYDLKLGVETCFQKWVHLFMHPQCNEKLVLFTLCQLKECMI